MSPVTKTKKCPDCNGHGKKVCQTCQGEGEIVLAIDGKPVKAKTKKKAAGK